jgi:hypothetical protein
MPNCRSASGKLLSEDGELTLIVLALDPDVVASNRLREVIGEIQKRSTMTWPVDGNQRFDRMPLVH